MDNLAFLAPLLFISGVAVIILAIIAVVQDMKQDRKYGYRQAFFTIVSLVMFVIVIGSAASLISIGFKYAVPSARTFSQNRNVPPAPFITAPATDAKPVATAYACTTDCQFTATDKQNFSDWKVQYTAWKTQFTGTTALRRDMAGALAFLIIALPLYIVFMRWMNRGAKEETVQHLRPSPLRSVYYYGIAFAGLVMAVVGGAMLLNTGLKSALHTPSIQQMAVPSVTTQAMAPADSIINCASKCGFSADDVAMVKDWKAVYLQTEKTQQNNTGAVANDVASALPYLLLGVPIFWLHFVRIRKEAASTTS